MRRTKNGYTIKQNAYAMRVWGGDGLSKRQIAKAVGYSQSTADHTKHRIENTEGYSNAIASIASQTGALAMKVFQEINRRDLTDVPLDKLLNAVSVIANAWKVYNPESEKANEPLQHKALLLQHIEHQTIQAPNIDVQAPL